jgi:DHA2 family multidrug resistance protein-like MFS transporter
MATTRTTTRDSGPRAWASLAVLVLPCLLVSMDGHVLNLALPQLSTQLRPSAPELLWIVDGYGFCIAGALLVMGALADRFGRRRLLLVGAAAFAGASTAAAFATTPAMLIAARAAQGVAGATLMPSTLALIRVLFVDVRHRRIALGVWAGAFAVGGLVAPAVAGLLLERFWWGSVFLLALPAMALLLVLGPVLLPESRAHRAPGADLTSAALALAGVLAAVYGVKQLAAGASAPVAFAAVGAGVVLCRSFLRRQRRSPAPWIDPETLRRPMFAIPLATNATGFFVLYGTSFFLTQYLQLGLGLRPLEAGLWTVPSSLGWLLGSVLGPQVAGRAGPRATLGGSLLMAAGGVGVIALLGPQLGLPGVVAGSVIFSVGLAPAYLLATDVGIAAAPPDQAGAASGLLETSAELGGALGIALLGSLGAGVYRVEITDAAGATPGGFGQARESLAGALSTASALPDPFAGELARQARAAFVDGFRIAEVAGAVLLVVLSAALVVLLGDRPRRRTEPAADDDQELHEADEPERGPGRGAGRRPPVRRCRVEPHAEQEHGRDDDARRPLRDRDDADLRHAGDGGPGARVLVQPGEGGAGDGQHPRTAGQRERGGVRGVRHAVAQGVEHEAPARRPAGQHGDGAVQVVQDSRDDDEHHAEQRPPPSRGRRQHDGNGDGEPEAGDDVRRDPEPDQRHRQPVGEP